MKNTTRLGKAAYEFNISMDTIVKFLFKNGIYIDATPTTKIEESAYDLLKKEFAKISNLNEKSKNEGIKREKRETISLDQAKDEKPIVVQEEEEFDNRILDKMKGEIPAIKVEAVVEAAPVVKTEIETPAVIVEPKIEEKLAVVAPENSDSNGGLNVLGKIDLDKLKTKISSAKEKTGIIELPKENSNLLNNRIETIKVEQECYNKISSFTVLKLDSISELEELTYSSLFEILDKRILDINISIDDFNKKISAELQEKDIDQNVKSSILKFWSDKKNDIIEYLNDLKNSTPSKEYFTKIICTPVYINWEHIIFIENGISFKRDSFSINPVKIENVIKVFNEINVDYFQEKYRNEIYKLVILNGEIVEEFSDINIIKEIIEEYIVCLKMINVSINEEATVIQNSIKVSADYELSTIETERIVTKNQYLSIARELIKFPEEIIIGLRENNNFVIEDAIVFIYIVNGYKYILWENPKEGKAGYLFEINSDFEVNFEIIKNYITRFVFHKRSKLQYMINTFLINNKKYTLPRSFRLIHKNIESYKRELSHKINRKV